jgi:hypothetical protein
MTAVEGVVAVAPRAVVTARWWVGDEHDPQKRSVAFVIVDDPGCVTWAEQIRRIADLVPLRAHWEVLPVPADVSGHHIFMGVPS